MKEIQIFKGFTLIEILVAISILSVIGLVAVPNLSKFNDNQILQNTTNDLVRVLREAQSSANSQVKCTNDTVAKQWQVAISSNNYQLQASCYDLSNPNPNPPPAPEGRYAPAPNTISGVTIASSPCALPLIVTFSAENGSFNQNQFSNISFIGCSSTPTVLQITLTKNGSSQYVCVNKGGAIYVSASSC